MRWTIASGVHALGGCTGSFCVVTDISEDGLVVVGGLGEIGEKHHAYMWTMPGGFTALETQDALYSFAWATSRDGSVVAGTQSSSGVGNRAIRWTSNGLENLGILPLPDALDSEVRDLSADGSVVVGYTTTITGASHAFRWTPTTGMVGLPNLPPVPEFPNSQAFGVSPNGLVAFGNSLTSNGGFEPCIWPATGGVIGIGGSSGGRLHASSWDGSVLVGTYQSRAGIWYAKNGPRSLHDVLEQDYGLDLTGWTLQFASDITPDGITIVGIASPPSGGSQGFIARLCPRAAQDLRQCSSTPAEKRYIPELYDAYLASLEEQFQSQYARKPVCPPIAIDPDELAKETTICNLRDAAPFYRVTAKGCELTAYAIALRNLGIDPTATPANVHDRLLDPSDGHGVGFTPITGVSSFSAGSCGVTGPVARMIDGDVDQAILERKYGVRHNRVKQDELLLHEKLAPAFAKCYPVMFRVNTGGKTCNHWVIATGQKREASGWWYNVTDPGSSAPQYNGWRQLDLCMSSSARVIMPRSVDALGTNPSHQTFGGQVNSPIQTAIIDPLGRRLECDSNGIYIDEIPDVGFEAILPIGTPEDGFTPEEVEEFLIDAPYALGFGDVIPGEYQVEFTGTGDGPYSIDFEWIDQHGCSTFVQLAGTITFDEVITHNVTVGACVADFDCDRLVGISDLQILLFNFGQTTPDGDVNGDNVVDLDDLQLLLFAFGTEC